ncbi:hypothetical protein OG292_22440 [Streptomyces sp. NBC_01511]|uniref:hypothetical protein n=1 Tax=Streptomyces sp. NBC_01511 TaxID=2903889 RepID=UPI0038641E3C
MPHDIVTTAQHEAAEARATLDSLTERVKAGDPNVTPSQLATQRELIAFAELRVEAAERKEAQYREDERAALGAAAKTAATELITGPGMDTIAEATKAAADAIAALAALAYERNDAIAEIGTTLARLDNDLATATDAPQNEGPWASRKYGVWGNRNRVVVDSVGRAPALEVGKLTVLAVIAGLGSTDQGQRAQTQHREAFHGLRNLVVHGLLEQYPQFAEEFRATPEEFAAASVRGRYDLAEQGRRPVADVVVAA